MTPEQWTTLIAQGGLGITLFALFKGWLVLKAHHEQVIAKIEAGHKVEVDGLKERLTEEHKDKMFWRESALKGTALAETAVKTMAEA